MSGLGAHNPPRSRIPQLSQKIPEDTSGDSAISSIHHNPTNAHQITFSTSDDGTPRDSSAQTSSRSAGSSLSSRGVQFSGQVTVSDGQSLDLPLGYLHEQECTAGDESHTLTSDSEPETPHLDSNLARLFRSKSEGSLLGLKTRSSAPAFPTQLRTNPSSQIAQPAKHPVAAAPYYCNVVEHHSLEDQVSALTAKLDSKRHDQNSREKSEITRLRRQLEEKSRQLEQYEERLQRRDTSVSSKSEGGNFNTFVTRLAALKTAIGGCSALTNSTIVDYLSGDVSINAVHSLVERCREVGQLADEADRHEQVIAAAESQLDNYRKLLDQCDQQSCHLEEKVQSKLSQFEEIEDEIRARKKEGRKLSEELTEAAATLSQTKKTIAGLQSNISQLEANKLQLTNKLLQIVNAVDSKHHEYQTISQELNQVQERYDRLVTEEDEVYRYLSDSDAVLDERQEKLALLNSQIKRLTEEKDTAEKCFLKQAASLKDVTSQLTAKRSELKELTSAIDAKHKEDTEKSAALAEEVSRLEKKRKEMDEFFASADDNYESICEKTEAEASTLKAILGDVSKKNAELEHLQQLCSLEQNQLDGLKTQHAGKISELQHIQTLINQSKAELDSRENQISQKRIESEAIQEELRRESLAQKQAADEASSMRMKLGELNKKRTEAEGNLQQLNSAIQKSSQDLESYEKAIASKVALIRELDQKLSDFSEMFHKFEKQKDDTERQMKSLQHQLQEKSSKLKEVEQSITAGESRQEMLSQSLTQLSGQLFSVNADLEKKAAALHFTSQHVASLEHASNTINELTNQEKQLTCQLEARSAELKAEREKSEQLGSREQQLQEKYRRAKQLNDEMRSELSQCLEDGKYSSKQLENERKEKAYLTEQLREARNEVDRLRREMNCISRESHPAALSPSLASPPAHDAALGGDSARSAQSSNHTCARRISLGSTPGGGGGSVSAVEAKNLLSSSLARAEQSFKSSSSKQSGDLGRLKAKLSSLEMLYCQT